MQHNIPEFLLELLLKQYGKNTTKSILKGYSNNRPITLRANTLKTSINYIKNTLNTLNISFKNVPWYTDALILENTSEEQIKNLDIYKEGFIYLQNLSSMIPPTRFFPPSLIKIKGFFPSLVAYCAMLASSPFPCTYFDGLIIMFAIKKYLSFF